MAEPRPDPGSDSQCSQLPHSSMEELIPPSHFVLRSRSLGTELEAEKGRSQRLEAELEAEKGRSQAMKVELEVEKRRSQSAEKELSALKGRSQRLEAELEAEKGRSQMLEMELEALRGWSLGKEGAEPSPEQVLLARWRQKVFQLLLQVRLHRSQELRLQGQVRSLDAAVAAGSRQVSLLELQLRQGEEELRGERQAVSQQQLRAEAAEEQLRKLGETLSRSLLSLSLSLAGVTAALGALGTLSERLARNRDRLRVLVTSGRLRVTARDRGVVTSQVTSDQPRGWHAGDTGGGGSVPKLSPQCHPQVTQGGDGSWTHTDTVSLAPLLTQLQALGAAILGDSGDVIGGTAVTSSRGER